MFVGLGRFVGGCGFVGWRLFGLVGCCLDLVGCCLFCLWVLMVLSFRFAVFEWFAVVYFGCDCCWF